MAPTFLFFGYGSEYSLGPLRSYMEEVGDTCVEIDMLTCEETIGSLRELIGHELVFITSAHLLYDWNNFFYYRTARDVVSPLHIISTLQPVASIYYPHDYKDPVKEEELPYLDLFDLLLWPDQTRFPPGKIEIFPVGWIKFTAGGKDKLPDNSGGVVFFPGALQYYLNRGAEHFYNDFSDILDAGAAVKLARWHGTEQLEALLRDRGVIVYPSTANSVEVMDANQIIITQALSSVALEACHLGKPIIYIRDDRFDYQNPLSEYRGCGSIAYAGSPAAAAHLITQPLSSNRRTMMPFDFVGARAKIWETYSMKALR